MIEVIHDVAKEPRDCVVVVFSPLPFRREPTP